MPNRLVTRLHRDGPDLGLLVVRVVLGLFWLGQLTWKPPPDFGCPDGGFCLWVRQEIEHPLLPVYATLLTHLVTPTVYAWGWFTTVLELAIGLSLLLGFLTRLGGLLSMLWSLNLLLGLAAVPHEYPPAYLMLALFGFLFLTSGGRHGAGLDVRLIRPRLARRRATWWTGWIDAMT